MTVHFFYGPLDGETRTFHNQPRELAVRQADGVYHRQPKIIGYPIAYTWVPA